jgi:hypothetical protein
MLRHQDNILIGQHVITFINPVVEASIVEPPPARPEPIDSEATVVIRPAQNTPAVPPIIDTTISPIDHSPKIPDFVIEHVPPSTTAADAPNVNSSTFGASPTGKRQQIGMLKVVGGKADAPEYDLVGLLTYIGKSESAQIRIKGWTVPDMIAVINKRPDGYSIRAIKENYIKVNKVVLKDQVILKLNDVVETAGLSFVFQMIDDPYSEA